MQPFAFRADDESQRTLQMTRARFDLRPGLIQPDDAEDIALLIRSVPLA